MIDVLSAMRQDTKAPRKYSRCRNLIWFSLAATGIAALAQTAHTLFVAVKFAGAGYLLYLAYRLWTAPVRQIDDLSDRSDRKAWRLFIGGVTLTLGNPKVMVFFMALLPTVIDLNDLTLPAFCQVAIAICVILSSVLTLYTIAAMRARRFFQLPSPGEMSVLDPMHRHPLGRGLPKEMRCIHVGPRPRLRPSSTVPRKWSRLPRGS